jgi:acyl-CoA synthetase (AMP-forming)/AMP-acid ligase II
VLSYGGAPMPFPVIRRAIERLPRTVGFVNAFGQTETTSTLTVLGPEDHRLEGTAEEVERRTRRLTSIGRPLPDVEVRIVDDDGRALGPGQVGEIHVCTPRVMKGYAGVKESPLTADGWLPTRDMGWIDDDGYLYIAGRKDDMIIRGGENIAPAAVEAALDGIAGVVESAVFGASHPDLGEEVVAAVVVDEGITVEHLREQLRSRIASFAIPTRWRLEHKPLPTNHAGKIDKKVIAQCLAANDRGESL